MLTLPIKQAQIVADGEVPPRKTKWAATLLALKSLKVGHTFTCQLDTPMHYEEVRMALYKGAIRLGFKIQIRKDNLKLYIKKISEGKK